MKDHVKECYLHLGLMSTEFAKVEEYIRNILAFLINNDNYFCALYAIEKNTLETNLQLLKKINFLVKYEESKINAIIEKLNPIKQVRNSFIHGVWSEPEEIDGEIHINVLRNKIQYIEDEGDGLPAWYGSKREAFTLKTIQLHLMTLEEIGVDLKTIFTDLLVKSLKNQEKRNEE